MKVQQDDLNELSDLLSHVMHFNVNTSAQNADLDLFKHFNGAGV